MLTFLYVLHFLVCFILIGVVLLQRGKGQDLGASLGGGGANTIFGSRGAGNFLTKITTGSAIIFMITSLSLSYLGYQSSDARLFDESEPFVPEGSTAPKADGGLEEIPAAAGSAEAGGAAAAGDESGGLVEIPSGDAAAPAEAAAGAGAGATGDAADSAGAPSGESTAAPTAPSQPAADAASAPEAASEAAPSAAAEPAPATEAAPAEAGAGAAPSAATPAPAAGEAPAAATPEKPAGQP